jgi:hypothetical protein
MVGDGIGKVVKFHQSCKTPGKTAFIGKACDVISQVDGYAIETGYDISAILDDYIVIVTDRGPLDKPKPQPGKLTWYHYDKAWLNGKDSKSFDSGEFENYPTRLLIFFGCIQRVLDEKYPGRFRIDTFTHDISSSDSMMDFDDDSNVSESSSLSLRAMDETADESMDDAGDEAVDADEELYSEDYRLSDDY